MDIDKEPQNKLADDDIEIDVDDDIDDGKSSHSDNGSRNGFSIQDILSPNFGNRQLKDHYYAYIQYCYSLQMHNMMLLRGAVAARNGLASPLMSSFAHMQQKFASQFPPPDISKETNRDHVVTPEKYVKSKATYDNGNERATNPAPRDNKIIKPKPISPSIFHTASKASVIARDQNSRDSHTSDLNTSSDVSPPQKEKPQFSPWSEKSQSGSHEVSPVNNNRQDPSSPGEINLEDAKDGMWPAWVYCTRYSDRPSSGPRSRKIRRKESAQSAPEKRPRIAFTNEQLSRLKREFDENRYLTEERRAKLAHELDLTDAQVKIWFQNKRAKLKKTSGMRNPLAMSLMAQGLYNHSTNDDGDQNL